MHNWLATVTASEPAGFLLNNVADAVIAVDADWNIQYWNQAATAIYGWPASDVLGRHIHPLLLVERYLDGSDPADVLAQISREGVWRGEVLQHHRDGRPLIVESSTHLMRGPEGAVIGMIAVNRDVTARHASEQQRREALAQAEQARRRLALLAEASLALASIAAVEPALTALAGLVVADMADWCLIDVCDGGGALRRAVVAAAGPARQGTAAVLREGEALPGLGAGYGLFGSAGTPEPSGYELLLRQLGATTAVVAPITREARVLGRLIVARGADAPPLSPDDQTLVAELAHRVALALAAAQFHEAAEAAARRAEESRALLESLINAAPVGFAFFDPELRVQVINERLAACNGYSAAAHRGRRLSELVPAVAAAADPLVRGVLETGAAIANVPLAGDDLGPPWLGKHWIETFYPVVTPDGQQLGVGVVSVDITELKQLGLDLAHSQAQLAGIIDSAMDAIITVDEAGRVVLFNQAAERLFGVAATAAIGAPLERFIPAALPAAAVGDPAPLALPTAALRADGSPFPIETSVSHLSLDGATLVTVILRDVTEQRLLTEQLIQARKLESIGRLAGGIAHDFNNLLAVMRGYIDLALSSLPSEHPSHADIAEARQAAERAARLTRQLLAFARRQTIEPQPCGLNDLIGDMDRLLRGMIGAGITLHTRLDPDVGEVMADPSQIEQVITNLAVNARDAMPAGGTLRIETQALSLDEQAARRLPGLRSGPYVRIAVSDTGIGMDERVRERAFEPFFTTKGPTQGTGLGLATSYGIVAQHGGSIEIISQPGAGATFLIYLPLARVPIAARAARAVV